MFSFAFYTIFLLSFSLYVYGAIRSNLILLELRRTVSFDAYWQGQSSQKRLLALKESTLNQYVKDRVDAMILYSSIAKWSAWLGFGLSVALILLFNSL
jgi:hypothetical protein